MRLSDVMREKCLIWWEETVWCDEGEIFDLMRRDCLMWWERNVWFDEKELYDLMREKCLTWGEGNRNLRLGFAAPPPPPRPVLSDSRDWEPGRSSTIISTDKRPASQPQLQVFQKCKSKSETCSFKCKKFIPKGFVLNGTTKNISCVNNRFLISFLSLDQKTFSRSRCALCHNQKTGKLSRNPGFRI